MSYVLYDSRGYLADGPSIQGLEDLYEWAPDDVKIFIEEGHSKDLGSLISALNDASADGDVESSRVALLQSAREAQDVLILNDGVMDEPRAASRNQETLIHEAADRHVSAIKTLFKQAFKVKIPRAALLRTTSPTVVSRLMEPALVAIGRSLEPALERALLACLADGGQAALDMLALRAAEWDEQKHPRDERGRFGPGDESNTHLSVDEVQKHVVDVALKMDFDPTRVDVVDENPREFVVGNMTYKEAGHFSPSTGRVQLNARMLTNHDVQGVAIHEIQHAQYDHVKKVMELEHKELSSFIYSDKEFVYFKRSGYPRPEKLQEIYDRFPASASFAKTWGDAYLGGPLVGNEGLRHQMEKENGHTTYAKSYWHRDALAKQTSTYNGYERALDETLAETVRYHNSNAWHGDTAPKPNWVKLANDVQHAYKLVKHRKV